MAAAAVANTIACIQPHTSWRRARSFVPLHARASDSSFTFPSKMLMLSTRARLQRLAAHATSARNRYLLHHVVLHHMPC